MELKNVDNLAFVAVGLVARDFKCMYEIPGRLVSGCYDCDLYRIQGRLLCSYVIGSKNI